MILLWHIDLVNNLIVGTFYDFFFFFADLQTNKIMSQILCNEYNMISKT